MKEDTFKIVYHWEGKGMNVFEGLTRDEALDEVRKLVNDFIGTVLPKLTKVYLQLETNKETDTSSAEKDSVGSMKRLKGW